MKPAWEPVILARKPGPMRELGIEECRIAHNEECRMLPDQHGDKPGNFYRQGGRHGETLELKPSGRWPANLILDSEAAAMLDAMAPATGARGAKDDRGRHHGFVGKRYSERVDTWGEPRDSLSGASRFFFRADYDEGDVPVE